MMLKVKVDRKYKQLWSSLLKSIGTFEDKPFGGDCFHAEIVIYLRKANFYFFSFSLISFPAYIYIQFCFPLSFYFPELLLLTPSPSCDYFIFFSSGITIKANAEQWAHVLVFSSHTLIALSSCSETTIILLQCQYLRKEKILLISV